MRLIDADELTEKAWRYGLATREDIAQMIANAPTVDAVKHGHWEDEQRGRWIYAKCGLCGTVHNVRTNYCPNCGAKMDEVEDE